MKKENIKNTNKKFTKGFTLMELLVVVLIIGILAAIALPQYKMAVAKSQYAKLMDISKAIASAQDRYFMVHGSYTTNFDDLDIDMPDNRTNAENYEYCYDWGGCNLASRDAFACMDFKTNTQFVMYLINGSYSENRRGRIFCNAYTFDTTDFTNRLCQQVTGKSSPAGSDWNYICGRELKGNSYIFSSF